MKGVFFQGGSEKLTILLRAVGLKGKQIVEAIKVTTEGIVEEIKKEIDKGNYKEVISFLGTNALVLGKSVILERLTTRVASRLMLRLGLPGIIAAGVVAILVPFVVAKLRKKAVETNDAGDFLKTFELPESPDLEAKIQKALTEGAETSESSIASPAETADETNEENKKPDATLNFGNVSLN